MPVDVPDPDPDPDPVPELVLDDESDEVVCDAAPPVGELLVTATELPPVPDSVPAPVLDEDSNTTAEVEVEVELKLTVPVNVTTSPPSLVTGGLVVVTAATRLVVLAPNPGKKLGE